MYGLVDGNNFYVSCERIFDVRLRRRPVVVLSNNDGCAIARSAEAKALGIKMGQPAHELRHLVDRAGLLMRSANFTLYGDISARVLDVVSEAMPAVEPYSIDENFFDLTGISDPEAHCRALQERIGRWIGIPTCVGIGPTKTLAKLANKIAKSGAGVVDLSDASIRANRLARFPVADVWGVGRRISARLSDLGVHTARDLCDASPDLILSNFGVVLARTQRELQGHPCLELETIQPDRQQVMVSRSFGERIDDPALVMEALATFGVRACEKLRSQGLVACAVQAFAYSDRFRPELPQHAAQRTIQLTAATADTTLVLRAIRRIAQSMLQPGIAYKKAGVCLMDLAQPSALQGDLFSKPTIGNDRLMATMDQINRRFGSGTVGLAASGWNQKPAWGMRQLMRSPHYTTNVMAIPRAKC